MGPDADDEQLQAARTPETAPTKLKGSRRLKPWQIYAVAIAVVVVVLIAVLVPVLVHIEDRRTHEHQAQVSRKARTLPIRLGPCSPDTRPPPWSSWPLVQARPC